VQLAALNCDLERISGKLEKLTIVLEKICGGGYGSGVSKVAGNQYIA